MTKRRQKKDKWYTIKPRIFEMSSRQIAAMNLFTLFMIAAFLQLSQGLPSDRRYEFIRNTVPSFLGLFLASGGAWLYKQFKPDTPGFKGYSLKRWLLETVYGITILAAIMGSWVLLYRAGYPNSTIATALATIGGVILVLVIILYTIFRRRERREESAAHVSGDE